MPKAFMSDRHINEEPVNSQEIFFQDAYEACNK